MDPSKLYIQLGPVTPLPDPSDPTPRISPHEVNFNIGMWMDPIERDHQLTHHHHHHHSNTHTTRHIRS